MTLGTEILWESVMETLEKAGIEAPKDVCARAADAVLADADHCSPPVERSAGKPPDMERLLDNLERAAGVLAGEPLFVDIPGTGRSCTNLAYDRAARGVLSARQAILDAWKEWRR